MGINQGDVIDVGDHAPTLSHREAVLVKVPIDLGHGVTTRLRAFSPRRGLRSMVVGAPGYSTMTTHSSHTVSKTARCAYDRGHRCKSTSSRSNVSTLRYIREATGGSAIAVARVGPKAIDQRHGQRLRLTRRPPRSTRKGLVLVKTAADAPMIRRRASNARAGSRDAMQRHCGRFPSG